MSKEEKLTQQVKHLFNTIGVEDILREEKGVWFLEDKPLNEGQRKLLISEATVFTKTLLWKVLQTDVKYQANKKMFELSNTEMDLTAGKLWLETLNCFRTRLESMCKGLGMFNTKNLK